MGRYVHVHTCVHSDLLPNRFLLVLKISPYLNTCRLWCVTYTCKSSKEYLIKLKLETRSQQQKLLHYEGYGQYSLCLGDGPQVYICMYDKTSFTQAAWDRWVAGRSKDLLHVQSCTVFYVWRPTIHVCMYTHKTMARAHKTTYAR